MSFNVVYLCIQLADLQHLNTIVFTDSEILHFN